ncbi:CusA/CzcA family heavy metal efflux RND transporter [Ferrovibrio sp.]|uniref:efflux RND transporter permease subunit n=1 Tax=Ferrovibrio sp. TaxID=1917215 RepID=UPI00312016AF
MINRIIDMALNQRFLIGILTFGLVVYGWTSMQELNVDAFPDVTNVQVQINTEAPGLAASEVEQLVTYPVESVMNGLPDVTEVRSISKTGLSVVTVVFADKVDIYFARQLVLERLQIARERIPDGLGDPEMGPITTGLGQVYKYLLSSPDKSLMELRSINDWLVKFQLRTVPGITDVLSNGGVVRQFQVKVTPERMIAYDVTWSDIREAIQKNNRNAGGWYIEGKQEQLVVRGEGLISGGNRGLADIERIVLKTIDGTPVYVRDVADVEYGAEIRQGAVSVNGDGEAVTGVVLQLKGANTRQVLSDIRRKVEQIQKTLPTGVRIDPIYDQSMLGEKAVTTVVKALTEAAVLIVFVLFIFLWNVRAALIVVCSIPISMLVAFIMMRHFGLSANLQSLGGLAIGIGMMVDGSVVMIENIMRHLAEEGHENDSLTSKVRRAAEEVGQPVFFAVLIIVVVFLPLFTLEGVEGKMFSPMAFTIAFAMLGSLIVALTVVPVLASVLLRGKIAEEDTRLLRVLKAAYHPLLVRAIRHRAAVVVVALTALGGSLATVPFLGTEFVPELNEGSMSIRVTMSPSISLGEAKRIGKILEKKLIKYPEVIYAVSQIGRPELGGDPEPISNNEILVVLKDQKEWTTASTKPELVDLFERDLAEYPGVTLNFGQPIASRVDELLSGVKAQLAVKLFGEDLGVLEEKGREIEAAIKSVKGAADVQMEQIGGEAQLVVRADHEALARYGLNVADVMEIVSTAVGGEPVSQVIEGQQRYDIYLRVAEESRDSAGSIGNLLISGAGGIRIPLSQVADIGVVEGPPAIIRESAQRRVVVQANIRDRDMGGFVAEAQQTVANSVSLPAGYFVTWGGQFENQQRAQRTLSVVVPISLVMIFLLLFASFGSVRNALLIILNVPFALIGGIFALAVSGQFLSVPASVGFIALFGVAVLNGVVMVSYINDLVRRGRPVDDAVYEGAMTRLRPVLTTATVASLGLIPLLLANGIGSEVQRPLATVVVGGLISSTVLTLLVLPALYRWFAIIPERDRRSAKHTVSANDGSPAHGAR